MIENSEKARLKLTVPIADLLASRGVQPVQISGGELIYHSPLRDDTKPSFYVNAVENVFKDMVVREHRGDVIRLVQLLDSVSFSKAIETLQAFEGQPNRPSFFLSGSSFNRITQHSYVIREVKLLNNRSLIRYVESRGISIANARRYLREVHYKHYEHYRYALGFLNDKDGYALRNGVGCKINLGPNAPTTVPGTRPESGEANVFEGMFDFLSALEHFQLSVPTHITYVLNSVSNLSGLSPRLGQFNKLNVYLDRDKAGRDALRTLQTRHASVSDRSVLYQDHNDFNDFLINTKNYEIPTDNI